MKKYLYRIMESVFALFTSEKKIVETRRVILEERKLAIEQFEREKKRINFYSTKKRYQKA